MLGFALVVYVIIVIINITNNHFLFAHCKKNARALQMSTVKAKVKP